MNRVHSDASSVSIPVENLSALIARLEAAEAGSRELDLVVVRAVGDDTRLLSWPPYTTSLDAALALAERVLPGCRCLAGSRGLKGDKARAAIIPSAGRMAGAKATTPALALCIATLRAKLDGYEVNKNPKAQEG